MQKEFSIERLFERANMILFFAIAQDGDAFTCFFPNDFYPQNGEIVVCNILEFEEPREPDAIHLGSLNMGYETGYDEMQKNFSDEEIVEEVNNLIHLKKIREVISIEGYLNWEFDKWLDLRASINEDMEFRLRVLSYWLR